MKTTTLLLLLSAAAQAQQVSGPAYWNLTVSVDINAPVDKVWARVGKFCDIGEWMNSSAGNSCKLLQGEGGPGSLRSVAMEPMVGATQYGYTYSAAPRANTPYSFNHGTLLAEPLTAQTTHLSWTVFQDNAVLAGDAARERDAASRRARYTGWLANMKSLVETGSLPAPAAPAGGGMPRGNPPAEPSPFLNPNPHFVSSVVSVDVNAPVAAVWARIGKFCDIGEWGDSGACTLVSGKDGEPGAVRKLGNLEDVLVARSAHSYTYALPLRPGATSYSMYHGTVEARARTATTSTIYYVAVMDNSALADDATREARLAALRTRLNTFVQNMKVLAEGGKVTSVTR